MKRSILILFGLLATSLSCAQNLRFKENRIKVQADADRDGKVSEQEAKAVISLSLMANRSDMFQISSYDDLRYFPNLEYLYTGYTDVDTIDLRNNPKIREVDYTGARSKNLTILFAPGVNMVKPTSDDIWTSSKKYIRKETDDACKVSVTDKDGNDVFITIEEGDFFSRCFTGCDANQNGKVTYAEAAEATTLSLHFGGRSNVIDNYDFLRFFPKLVRLHLGNTTVEGIDLSHNILLEEVNMEEALWLRVVKVAGPVLPKFYCPADVKIMTILVGDSVKMPSNPDQLNLEKYLDFSEEGIVSEKKD